MEKILKGDTFVNRYRFSGVLKTRTPLHIGSGESSTAVYSANEQKRLKETIDKVPEVTTVLRDGQGKPLIPGSTLRGVMRHWLLNVLAGFGGQWAADRNYEDAALTDLTQTEQIAKVKQEFSWLELLFGTPFHEGKIEVWDALCQTKDLPAPDSLLNWNPKSLTYIDTSVAIDPATGTAIENLLYKTEVVPAGVEFELNVVGQNLSEFEVGLILLALQGFNSKIYPIRIGARGGRGFGLVEFIPGAVYGLQAQDLPAWVASTVESFGTKRSAEAMAGEPEPAGYFSLPQLSLAKQQALINAAKAQLKVKPEG